MTPAAAAVPENMAVDLDRVILALSDALDFIGVDETGHAHRVALMAAMCADALEWSPPRRHQLVQAGLMHDCGVSSTREHRALVNEIMWEGEHAHCERGFAYLGSVPPLAHLAPIVLEHHTPWAHLRHRGVDPDVALAANLIYLVDRADAVRARGVAEGRAVVDVLSRYECSHFAPELMTVFREQALREAFWFVQEEPALRERVREMLSDAQPIPLSPAEIKGLARMFGHIIDAKSPFTERHSMGVARVARRLGAQAGLPPATLDVMEVAALLHDVGKLRIPDELLDKQGPLTAEERRRMARHAFDTYEVLRRAFGDGPVAQWAAFHHEYVSGHGYPFHVENGKLPLEARIIAVADVLQALAQTRPYRQPLAPPEIVAILDGMVFGGKLDREVVEMVKADLDTFWKDAVALEGPSPAS
ncbi:MAG TPA: HD domain-containing phosphohydrolase [Magnetospirillum sp.]|nr:HD domain-containing phosphohydrolase [Magnetospirillum sp.]